MTGIMQMLVGGTYTPAIASYFADVNLSYGWSIATDSADNIYTYGRVSATGYTSLIKYDKAGAVVWKKICTLSANGWNRITVDSSGNIIIVRGRSSAISVIKFDSTGAITWQKAINGFPSGCSGVNVSAGAITTDSSGNIYVCAPVNAACLYTFSVVKLSSAGAIDFSVSLTNGFRADGPCAIKVDSTGRINIATGNGYPVVLQLTSAGAISWIKRITSVTTTNYCTGLVLDSSDNIYAVGKYDDSNLGFSGSVIVKFDSSGTVQWNRIFTSASSNGMLFYGVGIDSSANIYCFGNQTSAYDQYIVKYNSAGTIQWQRSITSTDARFNTYDGVVSSDGSPVSVSQASIQSTGTDKQFVAKIPATGGKTGTYTLSTISYTYAASSGTDQNPTGITYAAGGFSSTANTLSTSTLSETVSTSALTTGLTTL
jgi:hypothetical protein